MKNDGAPGPSIEYNAAYGRSSEEPPPASHCRRAPGDVCNCKALIAAHNVIARCIRAVNEPDGREQQSQSTPE